MTIHENYRDAALKELRLCMSAKETISRLPTVKLVAKLPVMNDQRSPHVLYVPWLHENFIQVGRALAAVEVNCWRYDAAASVALRGHALVHNYVKSARLARRWEYPVTYNGVTRSYRGWRVDYIGFTPAGELDLSALEEHPIIKGLHGVAANNRKNSAVVGTSRVMSWEAIPKYAVIAALLSGHEVHLEAVTHYDFRKVVEAGFQSELQVMSGEWNERQTAAAQPLIVDAFAGLF